LLDEALVLVKNAYGVYVIQHLLVYACTEQRRRIVDLLVNHASDLCSSSSACSAIEEVLGNGSDEDRAALADAILKRDGLATMACTRHGHQAAKTMLEFLEDSPRYEDALVQLSAAKGCLSKTRYGRVILKMVEEKRLLNKS